MEVVNPEAREPNNHLNTFRILYIIKGCFSFLMILFFSIYIVLGQVMSNLETTPEELPFNPFAIFTVFGIVFSILALAFGIMNLIAASALKHRKNYTFIFVVAILNCLTGVLGILLGVFTIIELNKPHVKALFGEH